MLCFQKSLGDITPMQLLQDVQMSEPAFKPPLCVLLTDEQRVAVQELE